MLSLLLSFDHHCHFRHFVIVIVIVILSLYSWSFMTFVVVVFSLVSFLDFVFSVFCYNPRRRKGNPPIRYQMINSKSNAPVENKSKYILSEILFTAGCTCGLAVERAALTPELFDSSEFETSGGFYSSARREKFVFISFFLF